MTHDERRLMYLILADIRLDTEMGQRIASRLFLISKEKQSRKILDWLVGRGYVGKYFAWFFNSYSSTKDGIESIKAEIEAKNKLFIFS